MRILQTKLLVTISTHIETSLIYKLSQTPFEQQTHEVVLYVPFVKNAMHKHIIDI